MSATTSSEVEGVPGAPNAGRGLTTRPAAATAAQSARAVRDGRRTDQEDSTVRATETALRLSVPFRTTARRVRSRVRMVTDLLRRGGRRTFDAVARIWLGPASPPRLTRPWQGRAGKGEGECAAPAGLSASLRTLRRLTYARGGSPGAAAGFRTCALVSRVAPLRAGCVPTRGIPDRVRRRRKSARRCPAG